MCGRAVVPHGRASGHGASIAYLLWQAFWLLPLTPVQAWGEGQSESWVQIFRRCRPVVLPPRVSQMPPATHSSVLPVVSHFSPSSALPQAARASRPDRSTAGASQRFALMGFLFLTGGEAGSA